MKWFSLNVALGMALSGLCSRAAAAQDAIIRLSENAAARSAVIRLADLLPADAPAVLREAGNRIELGRAPLPGSTRIFQGQQITARLTTEPAVLQRISIPSRVTVRRSGWPISAEAVHTVVSAFLRAQAKNRDAVPATLKLGWPAELAAAQKNPTLQVSGANWDGAYQNLQVRVRCVQREVCGSFLARVSLPPELAAQWSAKPKLFSHFRPEEGASSAIAPQLATAKAVTEAGDSATLIVESGDVHISMPVVCLQRGALRQEIRVRDIGSARVFRAEVLGKGKLRAVF